jgi:hypothetical protein
LGFLLDDVFQPLLFLLDVDVEEEVVVVVVVVGPPPKALMGFAVTFARVGLDARPFTRSVFAPRTCKLNPRSNFSFLMVSLDFELSSSCFLRRFRSCSFRMYSSCLASYSDMFKFEPLCSSKLPSNSKESSYEKDAIPGQVKNAKVLQ